MADEKVHVDQDLQGNKIINGGFEVVASLPTANNFVGRQVTYQGRSYIWDGSAWKCDATTVGGYDVINNLPVNDTTLFTGGETSDFPTYCSSGGLQSMRNILDFIPLNKIIVEYSDDLGITWADFGLSDLQKGALFYDCGESNPIQIQVGRWLRITFDTVPSGTSTLRYVTLYSGDSYTILCSLLAEAYVNNAWKNMGTEKTQWITQKTVYGHNYGYSYSFLYSGVAIYYTNKFRFTIKNESSNTYRYQLAKMFWFGSTAKINPLPYLSNDYLGNVTFKGSVISNETINFDTNNIEPTQTGIVTKTSTWTWQYLVQSMNYSWLKLKTWVGGLFSAGSATTNNNYLPKIDDVNKKLVKSNIYDDGTTPKYGANTIWHSGNDGSNSGLEADLLDGKHASDFATSTHTHNYTTSTDVSNLINTAIASVYKPKGNIANKTALLALTNIKQGDVYNAQLAFTLNGQNVKAGDNIVCLADAATSTETNWDNLGGNIDFAAALSQALIGFGATSGNITSSDTILSAINKLAYDKHIHGNLNVLDLTTAAFTTEFKNQLSQAYSALHSHSNKTTLDAFTTALKTSYDGAVTNSHTHSNKTILDAITAAFTTELQASYATAVTNSHTHSNAVALNGVTGTNTGDENTTRIGRLIRDATEKTTPVDADMVGLMDSAASNVLKKLSWARIKATLKAYFDTMYTQLSFSKIKVGGVDIAASTYDDIIEFIAGTNVTLTPDAGGKKLTIATSAASQSQIDSLVNTVNSKQDKVSILPDIIIASNGSENITPGDNQIQYINLSGATTIHTINLNYYRNSTEEYTMIIVNPNAASRITLNAHPSYKFVGVQPSWSYNSWVICIWRGMIFANVLN